jgi:sporulation integral membrane protein YlbJ
MREERIEGRGVTLLLGVLALVLTMALIAFSEAGFQAAVAGLRLFFDVVLPSLLPFFILSELLLALGVVHFLGEWLEPIMRPVFNVPGVGSFVFSMGLAAGYPMDAVLTAKFRRQNLCTRVEGERLLAFTNSADPLFIFGAVAVAMFHDPTLGAALAFGHYLGALGVGLIFRFHGLHDAAPAASTATDWSTSRARAALPVRAVRAALAAREADGRPLMRILNEAIVESARTLLVIASFIVLFSVLLRVITVTHAIAALTAPMALAIQVVGLPASLAHAAVTGLFEIDLGCAAAAAAHAPLVARLALAGAIIAWSGLSVHAQVLSVLAGTDIRIGPYYVARLIHSVLAGLLTVVALGPGRPVLHLVMSLAPAVPAVAVHALGGGSLPAGLAGALGYSGSWAALAVGTPLIAIVVLVGLRGIGRMRLFAWRSRLP